MKHKKNICTTATSGHPGSLQMRPLQSVDSDPGWGSVMLGTTSSTDAPWGEVEISKINHVEGLDPVISPV